MDDKFEKLLNDVQEIKTYFEEVTQHLDCAGTCETEKDLIANLKDALSVAK